MTTLFESNAPRPLADRLRPARLSEVVGQDHMLGPDGPIGRMVAERRLASLVLWGPPGCGKTTIARLIADHTDHHFEAVSAVFSGIADLRKIFAKARELREAGRGTVLFVDEIHRFNRAQQDGMLPFVEDGTVILIGATTDNPSFEIVAPLLSRSQVMVLNRLDEAALETLLARAEAEEGAALPLDDGAREALRDIADGDGRYLLNLAEELFALNSGALNSGALNSGAMAPGQMLDRAGLAEAVQQRAPLYDKAQEGHYNLISALHKSLRGSDCDAALYWLARMLAAGEAPLYIARRLVRFASEDIGLADPQALVQALAAKQAYDFIGSPEGELALAQCVIYLATAPKSNAAYRAYGAAKRSARDKGSLMPPKHILNAPTKLMKDIGYGKDYEYDHDAPDGFSGQNYFPDDTPRETYYRPTERGFEREVTKRLAYWAKLRDARSGEGEDKP